MCSVDRSIWLPGENNLMTASPDSTLDPSLASGSRKTHAANSARSRPLDAVVLQHDRIRFHIPVPGVEGIGIGSMTAGDAVHEHQIAFSRGNIALSQSTMTMAPVSVTNTFQAWMSAWQITDGPARVRAIGARVSVRATS